MKQTAQLRIVRSPEETAPRKLHAALALLIEAHDYARDVRRDIWEFAVEIETLRAEGLTPNDLRWLVGRGYVEVRCEKTRSCDQRRDLSACRGRSFGKRTCKGRACFIPTETGLAFAHQCLASNHRGESFFQVAAAVHTPSSRPRWAAELRELYVDGQLVKKFRTRAPNQEAILIAFEEEGWPCRIDDPLIPIDPDQNPKRRLNDTIKGLNSHQAARLIQFGADGTGQGVRWLRLDDSPAR